MSGKRNWNRDLERRRAQEQGTASLYRGGPSTRPRTHADSRDDTGPKQPDQEAINARALWVFMREMARCEMAGEPTPAVPKQALDGIGVTSQTVATAWIRKHRSYIGIKQQLIEEKP
jgi:hypothetical protein